MRKLLSYFFAFSLLLAVSYSCKDKDDLFTEEVNVVSQFVYDGLSTYYYWANEVESKKPQITDVDPSNYFYKILNSTDTQHGWSWITDDVDALLAGFEGQSLKFSYEQGFTI